MLFIGVALAIAVALALLVSADAGSLVGLSQEQTGQLMPLLVIVILLVAGLFARSRFKVFDLIGNLAIWAVIFITAAIGYAYRDDISGVASRVFGELSPGTATVDGERGTATFRARRDGHFPVHATINGAPITTIFDTGASAVVLTDADARAAGIDMENLRFNVSVSTANGTGKAAQVRLNSIEIGGIVRKNVRAFVAERNALDTSLLGMSFLETLTRYSVSSNSLEMVD